MTQSITVRVYDIIGGSLCVSTEDGQRLYEKIAPLLKEGRPVALSFERIDTLISAFLNAAIGQLYGELPGERIHELLSFRDLADDDSEVLKRVVENAIAYFRSPDAFDQAWLEEMDDFDTAWLVDEDDLSDTTRLKDEEDE